MNDQSMGNISQRAVTRYEDLRDKLQKLEDLFGEVALDIQSTLKHKDIGAGFEFSMKASGRCQGTDVKFECRMKNDKFGNDEINVMSNGVLSSVSEFVRRHDFAEAHQAKQITHESVGKTQEDEIPF